MIKAHVKPNWQIDGVDIAIVDRTDHGTRLLAWDTTGTLRMTTMDPREVAPPTLALQDEQAMALLTALLAHYGHPTSDEARLLRPVLEREQNRVDSMLDELLHRLGPRE